MSAYYEKAFDNMRVKFKGNIQSLLCNAKADLYI